MLEGYEGKKSDDYDDEDEDHKDKIIYLTHMCMYN
jgi:hypothetical protein